MTAGTRFLLIFAALVLPPALRANNEVRRIHGLVLDRITAMPVMGAEVSADGNLSAHDAVTDEDGYFYLELATGVSEGATIGLYTKKSGYRPVHKSIAASDDVMNEILITSQTPATRLSDTGGAEKGTAIFINYLRLFGAFQVPVMLANQYLGPDGPSDESYDEPESNYYKTYEGIEPQVRGFWRNWEYKDARPIRSSVWRELFAEPTTRGSGTSTQLLSFVAAETGDDRVLQWAGVEGEGCHDTAAGWAHRECPGKYPEPEVRAAVPANAAKVGFLSLIIVNISSNDLLDVNLHFREFRKTDGIFGHLVPKKDVDDVIQTQPEQTQVIPRIKPHASVLWLLSIYQKDADGYPEKYFSSVIVPTRITFRSLGSPHTEQMIMRKPLMDKAAKILVPYGWYMQ